MEALKNQSIFRPDLDEIRTGNPKLNSKDQRNVIQHGEIVFDLRAKVIDFLFSYLELNTK